MKLKAALIFLLFILITPLTRAQRSDKFILSARQYVSPVLDLRLSSMQRDADYPLAIYHNNINFAIKQDYSNPSKYIVSLNPAFWAIEYGLTKLFIDREKSTWVDFAVYFPIFMADIIPNLKFDAYWAHFGWDTDFFIYNNKLIYVFSFNLGARYEIKRTALSVTFAAEYPNRGFMPPWEKENGKVNIELSYAFDNTPLTTFIFTHGLRSE